MQSGGAPLGERYAQRQLMSQGFLHSSVPGRTDKLPITVNGGAYVLPADHMAAIGQGNSIAGANMVNKMFKMGPYGSPAGGIHAARNTIPRLGFKTAAPMPAKPSFPKLARGGAGFWQEHKGSAGRVKSRLHRHEPVDIVAAGGEMIIPPEKIVEKFGSLKRGHQILDEWVNSTRRKHIKQLKGLKPPKKN